MVFPTFCSFCFVNNMSPITCSIVEQKWHEKVGKNWLLRKMAFVMECPLYSLWSTKDNFLALPNSELSQAEHWIGQIEQTVLKRFSRAVSSSQSVAGIGKDIQARWPNCSPEWQLTQILNE